MAVGRTGLIAALDVGTSKICCFIARVETTGAIRVIGVGNHVSRGIRGGTVVDMEATEQSIRAAVDAAERLAGETIRDVYVNLSGVAPRSAKVAVDISIAGHEVGENDLRRVVDQVGHAEGPDREVIHCIPIGYTIDGHRGIRDPRGMVGERLGVEMHVVTAAAGPIRNLAACISRAHLGITSFVLAPYASGLACLVEDEMDLGITLIDMGAGTTSVAVFYDGSLVHADVLAVGGGHITGDLARLLTTPAAAAERIKVLYGSAQPSLLDERETVDVPQVGELENQVTNHVPRSAINNIIHARVEETFEMVKLHLVKSGFDQVGGRKVVLTGGGSQLQGVRDIAAQVLDRQVRIGKPLRLQGLAEAAGGPAFSTCAGLLFHAARAPVDAVQWSGQTVPAREGMLARLRQWMNRGTSGARRMMPAARFEKS